MKNHNVDAFVLRITFLADVFDVGDDRSDGRIFKQQFGNNDFFEFPADAVRVADVLDHRSCIDLDAVGLNQRGNRIGPFPADLGETLGLHDGEAVVAVVVEAVVKPTQELAGGDVVDVLEQDLLEVQAGVHEAAVVVEHLALPEQDFNILVPGDFTWVDGIGSSLDVDIGGFLRLV